MSEQTDLEMLENVRVLIRAIMVVLVTVIVGTATYNILSGPLTALAGPLGRGLTGGNHPSVTALADAEEAILKAIEHHGRTRSRSDWDDHDRTVDTELHRRLGEIVEMQKMVAAKLAMPAERPPTPERRP
jgi:hypothetical protein